jgi:hypothetical protein
MALRIFISYSGRNDQVNALRLQTLATTRPGLRVYVPSAETRSARGTGSEHDFGELRQSDVILALVSGPVPPRMQVELQMAVQLNKPIIPIVLAGIALTALQPNQPVFQLDPWNPAGTEESIMRYLETLKLSKDNTAALGALALILVGLLILAKK